MMTMTKAVTETDATKETKTKTETTVIGREGVGPLLVQTVAMTTIHLTKMILLVMTVMTMILVPMTAARLRNDKL
jgi:hypothetical protein